MIDYDDIHEWWQHSVLRTIFWVIIQCSMIGLIEPKIWWFPIVLWFIIIPIAESYSSK